MHRAMFCRDAVGLVIHADDADDTEDVKTELASCTRIFESTSGMFQKLVKTSDIFHILIVTERRFPHPISF